MHAFRHPFRFTRPAAIAVAGTDVAGRVPHFDTLRAVACVLVYLYHNGTGLGWSGVELHHSLGRQMFFALSGYFFGGRFLRALATGEHMPRLWPFIRQRFFRIFPAFLFSLAALVLLRTATGTHPPEPLNVLLRATLLFNYVDRYDYFSISPVIWSLAIEWQFYFLLPLTAYALAAAFRAGPNRAVTLPAALIIVGVISRALEIRYVNHAHPLATSLVPYKWVTSHLDFFGWGVLARGFEMALIKRRLNLTLRAAAGGVACATILIVAASVWTARAGWSERQFTYQLINIALLSAGSAVLIVTISLSRLRTAGPLNLRPVAALGRISYSFYLYHVPVIFVVSALLHPDRWGLSQPLTYALTALACLPFTLAASGVGFYLLERPFLRKNPALRYRAEDLGAPLPPASARA